jgi:uncharacterized membrane protein YidH (DUF202 family)
MTRKSALRPPGPESRPQPGETPLLRDLSHLPSAAFTRHESMLINEISLVLAEKRTSLSVMRTGLAVLALPLSVTSVLIIISKYYEPARVMYLLGPLLAVCAVLTLVGIYLIVTSLKRIRMLNQVIATLKQQNTNLRELSMVMNDPRETPDNDF